MRIIKEFKFNSFHFFHSFRIGKPCGNLNLTTTFSKFRIAQTFPVSSFFINMFDYGSFAQGCLRCWDNIFFQILFGLAAGYSTGFFGEMFDYLSVTTHIESIARGVIDSRDMIFFLSLMFLGLILTEANLEKSRL